MAASLFGLFDFLPAVHFYAKDSDHRYIGISDAVLVDVFGLKEKAELLGKTDLDFQPPALAEAYHAEDRRVMESREPSPQEVWLVPHVRGIPKWYVSRKMPLIDGEGEVKGIAGVMYPIDTPEEEFRYFKEIAPVVQHIQDHFSSSISMQEMAELAGLSSTQFNHRFRSLLHMSPSEFLLRVRIQFVQQELVRTKRSVSEISAAAGFYDQSHLTKKFVLINGLTPMQYRKRFR
ncbi:MAG: AraC family transcriptional regulator [Verrucomicrobiota bacterium]